MGKVVRGMICMCDRRMGKREMLYYVQLCVFASEDSEDKFDEFN